MTTCGERMILKAAFRLMILISKLTVILLYSPGSTSAQISVDFQKPIQQLIGQQLQYQLQLQQQQQQQQQEYNNNLLRNHIESNSEQQLNVSQLLQLRFHQLFQDQSSVAATKQPQKEQKPTTNAPYNGNIGEGGGGANEEQSSLLETRRLNQDQWNHMQSDELHRRNYFKLLNKVFSRIDLPEVYRTSRSRGGHCGLHIGCVEEIPNFPSLLKKANVSTLFTVYTRDGPKSGHKIPYEPITHYQLQDANTTESELEEKLKILGSGGGGSGGVGNGAAIIISNNLNNHHHNHYHHHHHLHQMAGLQININKPQPKRQTAASWRTAAKIIHSQEYPFDLAALEQSGFNSSLNTRVIVGGYFAKEDEEWIDEVVKQWLLLEPSNIIKVSWADSNRGLYHSAAYNSRIVGRQLTLFLYYLDQMFHTNLDRFHLVGHSLGAHIAGFVGADNGGKIARITGLDPAGPIFVELNTSMRLDPTDAKFVDVVHTNGGTITKGALGLSTPSGHVDYYCNGGSVQPGCYFSSVTKSIMDPVERVACSHRRSYRYFIEIIKLAISELPVSNSIVTSEHQHKQSPFAPTTNETTMNANQLSNRDSGDPFASQPQMDQPIGYHDPLKSSSLPRAFLFEAKQDDLVKLMQPDIVLMSGGSMRREFSDLAPLKRRLEFHLLNPEFPPGKRGMYFFKTRSEAPFFATKQYALTLKTDNVIRRKIALMAKIDQTLVAEAELDEIPGVYTLAFAPNDPRVLNMSDDSRVPQLSIMWKHRSFNLLLNQQNELHLTGLELSQLDSDSEQQPIIRYSTSPMRGLSVPTASVSSSSSPSSSSSLSSSSNLLKGGFYGGDIALTRNQWYKFDGRLDRLPASGGGGGNTK